MVNAREIYPSRTDFQSEFSLRVNEGKLSVHFVDEDEQYHAASMPISLASEHPELHKQLKANGIGTRPNLTHAEIVSELGNISLDSNFEQIEQERAERLTFRVAIAQNAEAWWLSSSDSKDIFPWLDEANIANMFYISGGERDVVLNDFDGSTDPFELQEGLQDALSRMADQGIDISQFLRSINIVPSDSDMFKVPEETSTRFPGAIIAATAVKARRAIFFNAQIFEKDDYFSGIGDQDKRAIDGWGPTMVHEFFHLFDMGLIDFDHSRANQIGWHFPEEGAIDDYGDLIEIPATKKGLPGFKDITDDFGNIVRLSPSNRPQIYYGSQPGSTDGPVSRYASTSSAEDIAEAGATYIYSPESLGKTRTAMIKELVGSIAVEELQGGEVTLASIDMDEFSVWDTIGGDYRYKPPKFY